MIRGIYETSGGYLVVSNLCITILLSMVILLILLIWFHHMDTILVVLLVFLNLTLYLKLHYRMRTILGFMHINVLL